jgi:hypothetical protein
MTRRAPIALLLAILTLPLLLQGASLPHTHLGAPAGLFNQEHDLTLLATVGTVASVDALPPAVIVVLVVTAVVARPWRRPPTTLVHVADSRAPPVR